jgi:hypothetical protein
MVATQVRIALESPVQAFDPPALKL